MLITNFILTLLVKSALSAVCAEEPEIKREQLDKSPVAFGFPASQSILQSTKPLAKDDCPAGCNLTCSNLLRGYISPNGQEFEMLCGFNLFARAWINGRASTFVQCMDNCFYEPLCQAIAWREETHTCGLADRLTAVDKMEGWNSATFAGQWRPNHTETESQDKLRSDL